MKRMAVWLAVLCLGSGMLFSQSVNMKLGLFAPRLESDLWAINLENLRFNRSDMINAYYAGEYEFYFSRYASFSFEIGSYSRSIYTEYRDYTFEDGSPIMQNISLRIVPIEANLKYYPMGHRYRVFPFIGVGAGVYAWTYQQWGDFVNFEDDSVNEGFAETRRFALGLNTRIGLVYRFQSRLAFALEGKYQYLRGRLNDYFEGFDQLDMGGFSANVSINVYVR